jgi:uncharacterized protein
MRLLGIVKEIFRHPVKSFQGERIAEAEIGAFGMIGDRTHVFINHSRENKHLSAKQKPALLAYSAKYSGEEPGDAELLVTSPAGRSFAWDGDLLDEVRKVTGLELSMSRYPLDDDRLAAVDAEPILIVTEESLAALEAMHGQTMDMRRFRPNFVVGSGEGGGPVEFGWVGSRIRIGSAEFEITQQCERCMMVTVDPASLNMDPAILKRIVSELDGCFGVYAQVKTPGRVAVSDTVHLIGE